MKNEEFKVKDIRYGLMVIDPQSLDENKEVEVVHFVGYVNEPSEAEYEHLREELATDKEFGLTEIAHRLEIRPAPHNVIEHFILDINE